MSCLLGCQIGGLLVMAITASKLLALSTHHWQKESPHGYRWRCSDTDYFSETGSLEGTQVSVRSSVIRTT